MSQISDHNRTTSLNCLRKVIDTVEAEFGKSFCGVMVWALNKSLCWFYNDRHNGKVPMDDVGGITKNFICRKVKSSQIVVHTHK